MKRLFLLLYLLIFTLSSAQKSIIDKDSNGNTYHFDLYLETSTNFKYAPGTKKKYINTKNDNYFAFEIEQKTMLLFDIEKKILHLFKINKVKDSTFYSYVSSAKNDFTQFRPVKVKKLAENKYQLTKPYKSPKQSAYIAIINVEKSDFDALNALDMNDVINLDTKHINILRKKLNYKKYIIRSYQIITSPNKINYVKIANERKINITLIVPKELKYSKTIKNPRENL